MNSSNSKKNMGKSNSIITNMFVSAKKENKYLKEKKINDEISGLEYLYEIDYFDNTLEKIHFNEKIKESSAIYIDTYGYLIEDGFESPDGLHYNNSTYQKIYNYIKVVIICLIFKNTWMVP